ERRSWLSFWPARRHQRPDVVARARRCHSHCQEVCGDPGIGSVADRRSPGCLWHHHRNGRFGARKHHRSAGGSSQPITKTINLDLGSFLATIGLTIPAVAITNIFIGKQIEIGLSPRDTLLLALTLYLSLLTFGTGRTNILSGLVHLVVFATF